MLDYKTDLLWQLGICVAVFVIITLAGWSKRHPTVGLPICYLLTLVMIHWVGAFIHALPWYSQLETPEVVTGFQQCFYGVISFSLGYLFLSPFVSKMLPHSSQPAAANDRLPEIYIFLGFVFFAVIAPVLIVVPSIGAAAICGAYLVVVGICLGCWRAWVSGASRRIFLWLAVAALLPLITTLALGFIGFGASAALIVFTFVFSFYKPRWQAALAFGIAFFLGLSLYVTYMRDRTLIRDSVWGKESHSERFTTLQTTFSEFEFIDFSNVEHLALIDLRLNQNYLVGAAVSSLREGGKEFAKGRTIWDSILAMVPRILWPSKPMRAGSGNIVSDYTGIEFAEGTSVGVGQVLEFYLNFGTSGVIIGFILMGMLVGVVDAKAAIHLREGRWPQFAQWLIPGISLLQTGGSLVELTSSAAASVVLVLFVNKLVLPRFRWGKPKSKPSPKPAPKKQAAPVHAPLRHGPP